MQARLTAVRAQVQAALDRAIGDLPPGELRDAMGYACNGGKRIRAFLVMESARLHGVADDAALPVAAAVEALHAYSLVHDDLPAMDDDDLRRGQPDEAVSLLRGANPGLGRDDARLAVQRLAANPSDPLDPDDPFHPAGSDVPTASDTLPSAVAAKIATGNTLDAARRLRDAKPGLSDAEAREARVGGEVLCTVF